MAGTPGDVQSTLSELERKLKELERDLQSVGQFDAPAEPAPRLAEDPGRATSLSEAAPLAGPSDFGGPGPSPVPSTVATHAPPVAPAPPLADPDAARIVQDARDRIGDLHGQLDELLRFREELVSTANRLVEEYSRVLASLQAGTTTPRLAPAQPPQAVGAPPPPAPIAVHPSRAATPPVPGGTHEQIPDAWAAETAAAGPPSPPTPIPAAGAYGGPDVDPVFEGHVSVDAGPFTDIATLSSFEQALARVAGVGDVYVRGFEGNRALIDVQLVRRVALISELHSVAPFGFTATDTSPGRVTLTVEHAA